METKLLKPTPENIKLCAALIKRGELVAFPTETVYGLGANALNEAAVKKIYEAKGRPSDNPLIVHVSDKSKITSVAAEIPQAAVKLIDAFSPGPLTVVFKKKEIVPDCVTGGLKTVAVRIPSHPVALELIKESGFPICAPSANLSTKPSPTMAKHVLDDLSGRIPAILDGGICQVGIESTVVDVTGDVVRILRRGGIPAEDIIKVVGKVDIIKASTVALCPGMRYKHYAPKAEVLFSAYYEDMHITICDYYDKMVNEGRNPVILALNKNKALYGQRSVVSVGEDYHEYAHNLFAELRNADDAGYDAVIAEGVAAGGIGESLINRLIKSSGGQVI